MTALTNQIPMPPGELEPALTGDSLCLETWEAGGGDLENAAVGHWEQTAEPWTLCGTTTPGDVRLTAAVEAEVDDPWFLDAEWELPPSADTAWTRSVSAIIRDIFGELGLPSAPATPEPSVPALATVDDVAGFDDATVAQVAAQEAARWPVTLARLAATEPDGPTSWTLPIIPTEEENTDDRG